LANLYQTQLSENWAPGKMRTVEYIDAELNGKWVRFPFMGPAIFPIAGPINGNRTGKWLV